MHGKEECAKITGNVCNIPVENDAACNVLPRPVNKKGLVIVKLKRHLRYRGYVCFESVRPHQQYMKLSTISKEKASFMKIFPFPMV